MMKIVNVALLVILANSIAYTAKAQTTEQNTIIAASQAEASAIFFDMNPATVKLIDPGTFVDSRETYTRGGSPNFFAKAKAGKKLRIAYLGGSITRSHTMYWQQSAKFIQQLFPNTPMQGINGGISGTDADLGAARVYDHILRYNPDLLFIEFAVNGAFAPGVEGIIRQTKKYNPDIDICLIYTVTSEQLKEYENGKIPAGIQGLEQIAEHYQLPSIHMAIEAAELAKAGTLIEKADPKQETNKIVFSQDGVHPLPAGGDLYASAIARGMLQLKDLKVKHKTTLPAPLLANNWEDAKMLAPKDAASFSEGWQAVDPDAHGLSAYKSWFPYLMKAERGGQGFEFSFEGSMFGFFDIGGPEVGQLELLVDGKSVKLKKEGTNRFRIVPGEGEQLNRFNAFCNNRYRGQFIAIELPHGKHHIGMKISSETPDKRKILGPAQLQDIDRNPEKYNKSVIYLGKILIRGEISK